MGSSPAPMERQAQHSAAGVLGECRLQLGTYPPSTCPSTATTLFRRDPDRDRSDARGAAAVEFALVLTPLLVIVFGILQYGWYFNSAQSGTAAAADASRRLSVGDCQELTQLTDMVQSRLGAASANNPVAVTVQYTDTDLARSALDAPGVVGGDVTVRVEFQSSHFRLPFIPVPNDGWVTRTATARVEDTTASIAGC